MMKLIGKRHNQFGRRFVSDFQANLDMMRHKEAEEVGVTKLNKAVRPSDKPDLMEVLYKSLKINFKFYLIPIFTMPSLCLLLRNNH